MTMEFLKSDEVEQLRFGLEQLAVHHNQVSKYFGGTYPYKPIDKVLETMAEQIEKGNSAIAVLREAGNIAGFAQFTVEGALGTLNFLYVDAAFRGKGCGEQLMDQAMAYFKANGAKTIEILIIHGNQGAKAFYRRYGFQTRSETLTLLP